MTSPAPAPISEIELPMAKDILSKYSGGSNDLAYFVRQSEKNIQLLRSYFNHLFNSPMLEQIKSKLSGPARIVIINQSYESWETLK